MPGPRRSGWPRGGQQKTLVRQGRGNHFHPWCHPNRDALAARRLYRYGSGHSRAPIPSSRITVEFPATPTCSTARRMSHRTFGPRLTEPFTTRAGVGLHHPPTLCTAPSSLLVPLCVIRAYSLGFTLARPR
ncbi:MAG: hypothetical protein AVDCRST_MAG18-655 [uncultured Thermomicrobiales bacterium]|uniref:Uncharacterized protein n=1 Tax=uncultured Thermomicrobiales bacterium TaxID=1645740 RepID=A0A6J4UQT3_9BACT|nr:MAG: hypothetical protein AVDCRST_MAG18-655 [uncultured Thermomicrobiales bacterium]